jgi:hypothetical protein
LGDPPSVEGWHTGAEWIDSGSLVRRINFAADRLSNTELPGVKFIIGRIRAKGNISPEDLVDSCLDLVGPLDVAEATRQELMALAGRQGDLKWDTEEDSKTSERRIGDVLALAVASREYQFV